MEVPNSHPIACVLPECISVFPDQNSMVLHLRSHHTTESPMILPWWHSNSGEKTLEYAKLARDRYIRAAQSGSGSEVAYGLLFGDASNSHEELEKLGQLKNSLKQTQTVKTEDSEGLSTGVFLSNELASEDLSKFTEQPSGIRDDIKEALENPESVESSKLLFKYKLMGDVKEELDAIKSYVNRTPEFNEEAEIARLQKEIEQGILVGESLEADLRMLLAEKEALFREKEKLLDANIRLEFEG